MWWDAVDFLNSPAHLGGKKASGQYDPDFQDSEGDWQSGLLIFNQWFQLAAETGRETRGADVPLNLKPKMDRLEVTPTEWLKLESITKCN